MAQTGRAEIAQQLLLGLTEALKHEQDDRVSRLSEADERAGVSG
jgi:hypothetical protein